MKTNITQFVIFCFVCLLVLFLFVFVLAFANEGLLSIFYLVLLKKRALPIALFSLKLKQSQYDNLDAYLMQVILLYNAILC